jgi:hypothetical protein
MDNRPKAESTDFSAKRSDRSRRRLKMSVCAIATISWHSWSICYLVIKRLSGWAETASSNERMPNATWSLVMRFLLFVNHQAQTAGKHYQQCLMFRAGESYRRARIRYRRSRVRR